MLNSKWLKGKADGKGILYVEIGADHGPVVVDGEPITLPVRVALQARSTEYWIQNKPSDKKFGQVPRLGGVPQDDPDTSDERVEANYAWMKSNTQKAAVGINDADPTTGAEVWHRLELLDVDDPRAQGERYDEATDTVYMTIDEFDAGSAVTNCSNELLRNTNYGAGVSELPFRPFLYDVARADG